MTPREPLDLEAIEARMNQMVQNEDVEEAANALDGFCRQMISELRRLREDSAARKPKRHQCETCGGRDRTLTGKTDLDEAECPNAFHLANVIAPHPFGGRYGPAGIRDCRENPTMAGQLVRLLETRYGVAWDEAVRVAAGLCAQTIEETEGWWAFETGNADSPTDAEMIAAKRAARAVPERSADSREGSV